jgi:hypothetical protein
MSAHYKNENTLANFHTKVRNRMKVSTASQITFIKHNSLIQHADMFKKAHEVLSSTSSYGSGSVEDTDDVILDENSNEKNQANDPFDEFDLDNEYAAFTFD